MISLLLSFSRTGSYYGAQAGLNPLSPLSASMNAEAVFVTVGSTPSFADWLPFPGHSSLSYGKTQSAYPTFKSPGSHSTCAQLLWPGKNVWVRVSLSPQETASLEVLCQRQTGRPATTTALPGLHICSILALRLAPHHVARLQNLLPDSILLLLA